MFRWPRNEQTQTTCVIQTNSLFVPILNLTPETTGNTTGSNRQNVSCVVSITGEINLKLTEILYLTKDSYSVGWIPLDQHLNLPLTVCLTWKVTASQMLYTKEAQKMYKYNPATVSQATVPSFSNCIGTFTSWLPLWERCCPDPFTMESITSPPLAQTQLHGKAPVRSLQSNPQPFNDRKLSGFLSSTLNCVFAFVCVQTHISTYSSELVITREADDDNFTPRFLKLKHW